MTRNSFKLRPQKYCTAASSVTKPSEEVGNSDGSCETAPPVRADMSAAAVSGWRRSPEFLYFQKVSRALSASGCAAARRTTAERRRATSAMGGLAAGREEGISKLKALSAARLTAVLRSCSVEL